MKKALSVLVAFILALCMSGAALAEGTTYQIGICQLVQHVALDAATQGFQDALTEKLGDAVIFDVQNASGDSNTCSTIMNTFVSNNVDLIMANATPALQAAAEHTEDGAVTVADKAVFTIKNISASQLNVSPEELTERFVRGDAARSSEGSGLGLSIARSLAELQGGSLAVTVDGDLFKVTLRFSK